MSELIHRTSNINHLNSVPKVFFLFFFYFLNFFSAVFKSRSQISMSFHPSLPLTNVDIFSGACMLIYVLLFVTTWTVLWAPLPMGFSRHKYWSKLPCPPPGNLLDPRIETLCGFFTVEPSGKPLFLDKYSLNQMLGHHI